MSPILVIYHGGCLDGFGSAYSAYVHFELHQGLAPNQAIEYYAASHGDQPPTAKGALVYLLDFAYPRAEMKKLCSEARQVVVIDHHITAQQNLQGLDQDIGNLELRIDLEQSGAMLSWLYFNQRTQNLPAPRFIECIQDRDLWRWQFPESRDLNAALMSYPFDFQAWHRWASDEQAYQQLVAEGSTINRYRAQMIAQHRYGVRVGNIAGYQVPIVNCPRAIVSELLGELAIDFPFAAGYYDRRDNRVWSLRSTSEGLNVAQIAEQFGGGGHPNAAGFATGHDFREGHPNLTKSMN